MSWTASVALAALFLAGCGGSDLPTVTTSPDEAILQVEVVGGLAPFELLLRHGPVYSLAGDRQLISVGPQVAIYPGPMLPNYQSTLVSPRDLDEVLRAVVTTGLPEMTRNLDDSAASFVADAPTTVVTFWDEEGSHVLAVYGLGIGEFEGVGVQALADLIALLERLAAQGPSSGYQTDRVQVIGMESSPEEPGFDVVLPWPLGTSPGTFSQLSEGIGCMAFEGPAGEELLEVFAASHELTYFAVDGTTYRVLARQLLPGETGCTLPGF